jgi:6-phosphogluconolactonase/glucosamine-6-phosphate isomerase/deaminase
MVKGSHKASYYTELANGYLKRIERLKKESHIHTSEEERHTKEQKLIDAYNEYNNHIKPQLVESGIEYHRYNSKIEKIINSI